jgi:hypothetical protein
LLRIDASFFLYPALKSYAVDVALSNALGCAAILHIRAAKYHQMPDHIPRTPLHPPAASQHLNFEKSPCLQFLFFFDVEDVNRLLLFHIFIICYPV